MGQDKTMWGGDEDPILRPHPVPLPSLLLSLKFLIKFSRLYQKESHLCLGPPGLVIKNNYYEQYHIISSNPNLYIFFLDTF